MEYPSKNDLFLKFKAIYDEKDEFRDYILIDTSENFHKIITSKMHPIIGKKISEIVLESENDILNLKNLYYHMTPKTKWKFEIYNEELERWYLVNIFSDKYDYLIIFYTDISKYKDNSKTPPIKSFKDYQEFAKKCI